MNIRIINGTYSIIIGIFMMIMWASLLSTGQVNELSKAPLKIIYHLFAEFLTAALLIIGGYGLIKVHQWGFKLWLIAMGMLFYTVIVSAGYYADLNDMSMVIMFTMLQIATLMIIGLSFLKRKELHKNIEWIN